MCCKQYDLYILVYFDGGHPKLFCLAPSSLPNADDETPRPLKVTFSEPAEYWVDAIPIGNGRLGAMIWGCVPSEKLQLNGKSISHFLL